MWNVIELFSGVTGVAVWAYVLLRYLTMLSQKLIKYTTSKSVYVAKTVQIMRFIRDIHHAKFTLRTAQKLQQTFQHLKDSDLFARKKQIDILAGYIGRILFNAEYFIDSTVTVGHDTHGVYRDAVIYDVHVGAKYYDIQYKLPDGSLAIAGGIKRSDLTIKR